MKPIIYAIIVLLLTNSFLFGQRRLSRVEILKYWNLNSGKEEKNLLRIVDSDSALNVQLVGLVDSLNLKGIDSIIIFSTALPGYISQSKCDTGYFPITTFLIWRTCGVTNIQKIRGQCQSEIVKDSTLRLFDIYGENSQKLELEAFMPVIMSGQINRDKTVTYLMSDLDHEPKYSFFYKMGKSSKSFHFCQSYLDNKKSLFRDYNLALSAYQWWRLVKNITDKRN